MANACPANLHAGRALAKTLQKQWKSVQIRVRWNKLQKCKETLNSKPLKPLGKHTIRWFPGWESHLAGTLLVAWIPLGILGNPYKTLCFCKVAAAALANLKATGGTKNKGKH